VVNDDLRLAESVRSLLADEGYETRIARDGLAAIDTLGEWPADLVLLDLMMPHLNGWDFLARRAHEPALARSLVVVWSVAPPVELDRARALGADECLPGGMTGPDALLEVVSDVLTRRPTTRDALF
jgi:CheY-like chemotaxis protein